MAAISVSALRTTTIGNIYRHGRITTLRASLRGEYGLLPNLEFGRPNGRFHDTLYRDLAWAFGGLNSLLSNVRISRSATTHALCLSSGFNGIVRCGFALKRYTCFVGIAVGRTAGLRSIRTAPEELHGMHAIIRSLYFWLRLQWHEIVEQRTWLHRSSEIMPSTNNRRVQLEID